MKRPFNARSAIALRLCFGIIIAGLLPGSCSSKPQADRESKEPKLVTLVPMEWTPSLEQAQAYVEEASEAQKNKSQSALNRASQTAADLTDAQLFITYVLLMQRLDENDRSKLYNEQKAWLVQRPESARSAVSSGGGSLDALEYASEFRSITAKRQVELESRLARQLKQPDDAGTGEK